METNVLDERRQFIRDFASGNWSMTELCERYAVSRPTGYKWLARQRGEGDAGLLDSSRAPHQCPHRTGDDVEALLLAARREFGWGAKKLLQVLAKRHPAKVWPARSTVNAILERHGVLHKNRRRRNWSHPGRRPAPDRGAEPSVANRFQRAGQDRRRPLLLSADGHRPLQPEPPPGPRPPLGEGPGRAPGLSPPVSSDRPA